MLKIDAHQHFWHLTKFNYPWLSPSLSVLYRNYEPADLAPLLEACGVSGTVIVQATHDTAETRWFLSLAQQASFIKGVVGWVDLTAPDLAEQVAELQTLGPLCGIRHQVHDEVDQAWLVRPAVLQGLQTLARLGIAYDLLVRPPHLPVLPRLFDAVPNMVWIIDHIAKPSIAQGITQPWLDDMRRVAAYPNVVCKVSGMITEGRPDWTTADFKPYVEPVLEMFGADRLMFGSDWPVCLLAGSYTQVHDLVAAYTQTLSVTEQAAIWGGTAQKVYQLD